MSRLSSLAAQPVERRIDAIVAALESTRVELRRRQPLLAAIASESGLHPTALAGQLDAWLDTIERAHLERLVATSTRPLGRGHVLTLAPGNLPIVAAECLLLGVLAGVPHRIGLSTRATALASSIAAAIRQRLPVAAGDIEPFVWRHLDGAARREMLRDAERIVAYGSAETVEWIGAKADPQCTVVPHGPSIAVAWIEPHRLSAEQRFASLRGLARDLAAFDQRGCRSPHVLFVGGTQSAAEALVRDLAESALPAISVEWPRGRLSRAETIGLYMDRLTSSVMGWVTEGDGWRLTLEVAPIVARPSPLGRTLRVVVVAGGAGGADDLARLLETLPAPVGCIAVPPDAATTVPSSLPDPVELVPMGRLQQPPFDRLHDGRHRLDELLPLDRAV